MERLESEALRPSLRRPGAPGDDVVELERVAARGAWLAECAAVRPDGIELFRREFADGRRPLPWGRRSPPLYVQYSGGLRCPHLPLGTNHALPVGLFCSASGARMRKREALTAETARQRQWHKGGQGN